MEKSMPYLAVILIQSIYTGMFLLSKAAFDLGMNTFIFVFYRQAAASLLLAPLAFFIERKKAPPLSFATLCKIFGLALCGITASLNLYGVALKYTSASLASATANCLPAFTFFIAFLLGIESVKLNTRSGIVKIIGIAVCLGGVAAIAFYRGPTLKLFANDHPLISSRHHPNVAHAPNSSRTWIKGVFVMLLSNFLWGLWLVLQAKVLKCYPCKLIFTALQCFLSSMQTFVIAIAVERDASQWKLGWNIRLLAVAYCGVVVTGVTFYLQTWVIEKKGPVFLAMSTPLAFVFTIVSAAVLLGEVTTLGSVIGGIMLIGGLYCVLWGKSKEEEKSKAQMTLATPPTTLLP